MPKPNEQEISRRISTTGLTMLDRQQPADLPTTEQAWRKVNNIQAKPVAEVPIDSPDSLSQVDHSWLRESAKGPLFSKSGEFYISIGGPGSVDFGWTAVQWSHDVKMAERLIRDDGHLEFVGMSTDGSYICAVSTEEDDYWVIEHRFR